VLGLTLALSQLFASRRCGFFGGFFLIHIFFIYAHEWSGFWGSSDDFVLSNYDSHAGMGEVFWGGRGFG
jgi:hypothetical protein